MHWNHTCMQGHFITDMTIASRDLPAHHLWRMSHLQHMTIYSRKILDFLQHASLVHKQHWLVLTSQWPLPVSCPQSRCCMTQGKSRLNSREGCWRHCLYRPPTSFSPLQIHLKVLCSFSHSNEWLIDSCTFLLPVPVDNVVVIISVWNVKETSCYPSIIPLHFLPLSR